MTSREMHAAWNSVVQHFPGDPPYSREAARAYIEVLLRAKRCIRAYNREPDAEVLLRVATPLCSRAHAGKSTLRTFLKPPPVASTSRGEDRFGLTEMFSCLLREDQSAVDAEMEKRARSARRRQMRAGNAHLEGKKIAVRRH